MYELGHKQVNAEKKLHAYVGIWTLAVAAQRTLGS